MTSNDKKKKKNVSEHKTLSMWGKLDALYFQIAEIAESEVGLELSSS